MKIGKLYLKEKSHQASPK